MRSLSALALVVFLLPISHSIAFVPVTVEAEGGTLGSELGETTIEGVTAVSALSDGAGGSPGSAARVATYSVTFPEAGRYQLYARLYVGEEGASDDSFFYGNGFGQKDASSDADWILVNQLAGGIGSTDPEDYVPGEGAASGQVWKWVMLSGFDGGESPIDFDVPEGSLTHTFQVGAREDGLALDKFVFGRDGFFYTVENLDKGEAGSESTPNEPFTPTGPPIATAKWKFLGNIHAGNQLEGFEAYWNQVTPENSGKWGSVESVRDQMNWTGLDQAYSFAKDNGFLFRMHILIWGAQQPEWINDLAPAEQLEEIEEWIAAVAERYPDIDYLEVVNEPLHQAPDGGDTGVVSGRANYIEALGGEGESGWDWVVTSFQLARKYFPDTPLVLNDYGIIGDANTVTRYLEIIDLLAAKDLIDVIGFQAHAFSTRTSAAVMQENLDTLASRGLPIMVTEMDIDGATDVAQLADYKKVFSVFWDHPSVIGVTLWGFRPGLWRNDQGAFLVLANGAERPAMVWLQEYVAESDWPNFDGYLSEQNLSESEHGFASDFDGDGLSTGWEYLMDSDPEQWSKQPLLWQRDQLDSVLEIAFSSSVREGKLFFEASDDLENWSAFAWYDLGTRLVRNLEVDHKANQTSLRVELPLDQIPNKRFYRVYFER